jgi:hypothetical protein
MLPSWIAAIITAAVVTAVSPGTILGVLAISVGIIISVAVRITIITAGESQT